MSATLDKLVRMTNQIAAEFTHQQGANAANATWDHLWHFWDPSMRARLVAHFENGGAGLSEPARRATELLRSERKPVPQTPATEFAVDADGNTQGDAG